MRNTRILAICLDFIPSFDLGVRFPLEYLSKKGQVETLFLCSRDVTKKVLNWCDVLIAVRCGDKRELEYIKYCNDNGKYICYMTDDDLLNIPAGSYGNSFLRTQDSRKTILSCMSYSNCLWTTNVLLAEKYEYLFEKTALIDGPAMLLGKKTVKKVEDSTICIGFSGGVGHGKYLEKHLSTPLKQISEKYGNRVKFEFFGAKPNFIKNLKNCKYIKSVSTYEEYAKIMLKRDWDIGLAPLEYDEFSACKYYNKFLEYGSVGVAGIYSDVPPFNLIVQNKINGILTNNSDIDWYKAIEMLIKSVELRKTIVKNAKVYLEEHNTFEKISNQLKSGIPEIIEYKSINKVKQNNIKVNKIYIIKFRINFYFEKIKSIIKSHGFMRGSIVILKKTMKKMLRKFS